MSVREIPFSASFENIPGLDFLPVIGLLTIVLLLEHEVINTKNRIKIYAENSFIVYKQKYTLSEAVKNIEKILIQ